MDINRHLLHHTLTLVVLEINPIPRLAAFPDAYYTVNWQIRFEKPCLVDSMSKETSSLDDESIKHLFVFSPIFSHFYMALFLFLLRTVVLFLLLILPVNRRFGHGKK